MAGIYIHIPFCESKCSYCDFASFANKKGSIESYFQALYREIEIQSQKYRDKYIFETIYFGGGTPSFVDAKYIVKTVQLLKNSFQFVQDIEITIEMNPNSAMQNKIAQYKEVGINRFSIGLQTAIDKQLKEIGRVHTLQDFQRATEFLQDVNFNVDIMIGLKNQKLADILFSIDQAVRAGASHISVYALTVEEDTPIYKDYLAGLLPSEEEVAIFYEEVVNYLKKKNFLRYEVSNFSLLEKQSKHNLIYWHAKEYLGLGLSASSYMEKSRFTNTANLQEYISMLENDVIPIETMENIDRDTAKFEFIMLAFRLTEGILLKEYSNRFQEDFLQEYAEVIEKYKTYLKIEKDRVTIREEYLYVQNSILIDFLKENKRESV